MHRFSIFLVVAVIAVAGEELSAVENPWDTASDLLASSSSDPALAAQDVTDDAGLNSSLDMMATDFPCLPSSNDQGHKKQSSKLRRGQACPLDRSWENTTPPIAPEQEQQQEQERGQQPHQISNPDNTENNAGANKAASIVSSDFNDHFRICNPMLVGVYRTVPVCDSGKMLDRSIYQGRIDHVENIMVGGIYVLLDVTPVPFLYGCLGTSIAWCCKAIEIWHERSLRQQLRLLGTDCVAVSGVGVNPEHTGPIPP